MFEKVFIFSTFLFVYNKSSILIVVNPSWVKAEISLSFKKWKHNKKYKTLLSRCGLKNIIGKGPSLNILENDEHWYDGKSMVKTNLMGNALLTTIQVPLLVYRLSELIINICN